MQYNIILKFWPNGQEEEKSYPLCSFIHSVIEQFFVCTDYVPGPTQNLGVRGALARQGTDKETMT